MGLRGPVAGPPRLCTVDGCPKRHIARGLCDKHYYRMRKYGTTDDGALHHMKGTGTLDKNGYRVVRNDGRARPQHHVVMEEILGRSLHPWENVHHRNGVRDDNRPENLELWARPQPAGQRVADLVAWVVSCYPDQVSMRTIPAVLKAPASDGENPVPDAGQSVLVTALIAAAVCLVLLLALDLIHIG